MESFEEVYQKYLKEVYCFLLRLSGDREIAEELTQQTFAIAFEKLENFRGECKLSVWLCQIAKHEYYAWTKKQKRYANKLDENHADQGDDLLNGIINQENGQIIRKILHDLQEPYKEVFMLRVMGEVSYRDIGQLFSKSESQARVTYYRAKKMIVEKMGGAITVESELHEGSTFRFTIPYDMYNKQEKFKKNAEREQHLKVAIKSLQLRTLLVAEDVDSNFLLMNTVLGKKYKLIRARDGREALDMYMENHPVLIFMDIKMPYMVGLEATRLIRGYSKDIPIIALTAFAFESDREKAIEAGCNDYLTKPVSQEAIEKILDKYSL